MSEKRAEPRTVTMYAADWKIVENADVSSSGISAALRRIVREWRRMTNRRLVDKGDKYTFEDTQ